MSIAGRKEWYLFLSAASLIVTTCLLVSDLGQHALLTSFHEIPLYSWPKRQVPLADWERDTQNEYVVKHDGSHKGKVPSERFYEFNISERTVYIGGVKRSLVTVNGLYPGPLIEAEEGDTIVVQVRNQLHEESTSLHFHGMEFKGSNYFDGAVGITQCGIAAGESFTYQFTAGPSGTFWYHSHHRVQALKGFIGPLIVHPERLSGIDETVHQDFVLLLSDLYDMDPTELMDIYQEPWLGGESEPVPGIALIQGKQHARIRLDAQHPTRLRIINAASYTTFNVALGSSLPFTVIEADGTLLKETERNELLIFPAQRYSIKFQVDKSEWLHATPQMSLYDQQLSDIRNLNRSSLALKALIDTNETEEGKYELPTQGEIAPQTPEACLVEPVFESLLHNPPPHDSLETFYLNLTMSRTDDGVMAGAVNGKVGIVSEDGNLLMEAIMMYKHEQKSSSYDSVEVSLPRESFYTRNRAFSQNFITLNKQTEIVDLVIQNYDDGLHPMHIHGHRFWVMARGSLNETSTPIIFDRPLTRDVVALPQNEWVRIRMTVQNPGVWSLHCHIAWHGSTGMRTALLSQPLQLSELDAPAAWWDLCK